MWVARVFSPAIHDCRRRAQAVFAVTVPAGAPPALRWNLRWAPGLTAPPACDAGCTLVDVDLPRGVAAVVATGPRFTATGQYAR